MAYRSDAVDYVKSRLSPEPFLVTEPHGQVLRNDIRTRSPRLRTLPRVSRRSRFWEQGSMDNKGKAIVRRPSSRRREPVTSAEHINALSGVAHDKQQRPAAEIPRYRLPPYKEPSRPQGIYLGNSGDANPQSSPVPSPEDFDFAYTSADVETGKSSSIITKIEYTLVEDLDDELEELGRLTRAGNFRAAKAFFSHHLKRHIGNPLVFILYAELLLEIGDYKSIIQLEDIAQTAFPHHWRHSSPLMEDDDGTVNSLNTKLYLNWNLIHLIAWGRNKRDIRRIHVDLEEPWLPVLSSETFDSTQVRIFFLLARLWDIMRLGMPEVLNWRDWRATYSLLVDEQRAWDFRDTFLALINFVGFEISLSVNFFFDSETPKDFYDRIKEDWLTGNPDVSVYLALLDLLSSTVLTLISYKEAGELAREALEFADELGEKLMAFWPEQTDTRPYLLWLVAKAATAVFQKGSTSDGTYEGAPCSASEPGLMILPISHTMMPALPFYIPIKAENPGWSVSVMPLSTKRALRVVCAIAKGLEDYALQATCICELAVRSDEPINLMDELAEVQRDQGDLYGRLETCLAKYLVCQSEESKQTLRHELASFGYWEDVTHLSKKQAILVATRDVQLRALSPTDMMAFKSSISAALPYYADLPLGLQQDLDDDAYARDRREQRMPKNTRGQPHGDSDNVETTHRMVENRESSKVRHKPNEKGEMQKESSRSPIRHEKSIPRPQSQDVEREVIRIVDVPYEYTSTGSPIPVEHPEQSERRRTATSATVQSVGSSSPSTSCDSPEVAGRVEGPSSDSTKKNHTNEQEDLSLRETSKITDQVGHERGLGKEFPSVTSRPKRATSVDLGEFSRRSQRGPVSEERFLKRNVGDRCWDRGLILLKASELDTSYRAWQVKKRK